MCELFHRLATEYLQFEQAILAHYDMFFVVAAGPSTSTTVSLGVEHPSSFDGHRRPIDGYRDAVKS